MLSFTSYVCSLWVGTVLVYAWVERFAVIFTFDFVLSILLVCVCVNLVFFGLCVSKCLLRPGVRLRFHVGRTVFNVTFILYQSRFVLYFVASRCTHVRRAALFCYVYSMVALF